jgi:hypothetical protein
MQGPRDANQVLIYALLLLIALALVGPTTAAVLVLAGLVATLCFAPGHLRRWLAEGFWPVPGAPAPYAAASPPAEHPADAGHYPGAIDLDEYDTEAASELDPQAAFFGYRDRTEGDDAGLPRGNPYNTCRVEYPPSAQACGDDEADDGDMDADENAVYSGLYRNDASRVEAGIYNRRRVLDRYLRGELDHHEDRPWWGRHER